MASKRAHPALDKGLGALLGDDVLKTESSGSLFHADLSGGELFLPAPKAF